MSSPVFDGGDIGEYQEAVSSFTEEDDTQDNGGNPQSLKRLVPLFLSLFRIV